MHPRTGTGKKHCLGRELGEGSMYSFLPLAQERLHQPHSQLQGVECPGRIFFVKIIAKFLFKLNTVPSTVFWFCFQKIYFLKFSEMDFFFPTWEVFTVEIAKHLHHLKSTQNSGQDFGLTRYFLIITKPLLPFNKEQWKSLVRSSHSQVIL